MAPKRSHLRIAKPPAANGETRRSEAPDRAEGERLLDRHGLRGLRAAMSAFGKEPGPGWSHFWRGYVLQFDDLSLARAEFLAAETRFDEAGDAGGLDLSACALVQCTLLDNQSYDGFDARAARVAALSAQDDPATPLTWIRMAARLLLMAERRNDALANSPLAQQTRAQGEQLAAQWRKDPKP